MVCISLYAFIVSPKGTFKGFFRVTPEFKNKNLWLFSVLALVVSKLIFSLFLEDSPSSDKKDIDDLMAFGTGWIIGLTILGSLLVPIIEEILVRGYVLQPFLKNQHKFAPVTGLVFSSVLFAFAHESNGIVQLFSGFIYANLRIRQKSLLGSIILHSLNNFILLAVMGILVSINLE